MSGENIKHYCGIFGIYNHPEAARVTYMGLFALQHRGEEAAGICSSDGEKLHLIKGSGLVGEVFKEDPLARLPGTIAIGHTRYSTTGASTVINAQPFRVAYGKGQVAVAHNGNLVNAQILRQKLEGMGAVFATTMDSEIFVHLIAKPSYPDCETAVLDSVKKAEGAFSLVILNEKQLIAVRDPRGFRPLCFGKLGSGYVVASETCAFDLVGADFIREVEAGEVLVIDEKGPRSYFPFKDLAIPKAHCIFEHVYFARPDSTIFGNNVGLARERMGRFLAKEHPAKADLVVPVPDSGNFAAMGFSKESGIPLAHGFTRNHYIGRTFINPEQASRAFKVRIKLNPIREVIDGKRIVVVDDSIVRGNTAQSRIKLLRKAGAREVHMRVSCPPHISGCHYGIDFPSKKELIAANKTLEEIREFLNVDSIGYLSLEGMLAAANAQKPENFCTACFTGKYPTEISDELDKFKFEKKAVS